MCVRMCPLSFEESQDALEAREQTGRARVKHADEFDADFDAYPGARVPVYVPGPDGGLVTVTLTWGFSLEGKKGSVYNTRIESALEQLRQGRRGMSGPRRDRSRLMPGSRSGVLRGASRGNRIERENGKARSPSV